MKYHFKVKKERKGYSAYCLEMQGCVTQAETLKELHENMEEALNLFIDEPEDSHDLAPLPKESIRLSKSIVEVPLDPQIAFAFLVRRSRIKQGLSQRQAAEKMGFKEIYSYQRLEKKNCNPTLAILSKIKTAFPDFSIDYAF